MGKSTKSAAAPPDTISLHRKLDPIYECVDTGQNKAALKLIGDLLKNCLLYTSPSPRDRTRSRMPSSA